jgi:serine protease SohB
VFVVDFPGDVTASQVEGLREEVTAIVGWANATRGDRVLLVLNSGGGTVTGYGLAAAQLKRIKAAGLHLTVCVEQVAASGGYMMACTGDHICASPFAVLGSIGVITEIPNVYERLTKEGISFNTITAGKFKRTLTPTKKATKEDIDKTKQDIEQILVLFKNFVASNRPQLDIDNVATGETWFGPDALKNKLVDELVTADDKLLELRNVGCELLSVKYDDPRRRKGALGSLLPSGDSGSNLADIMSGLIALSRLAKTGGDVAGLGSIMPSSGRTNSVADEYMAADPRDYQDYRM